MKSFDFYEFAGVIAPGTLLLFALTMLYPETASTLSTQGRTVGDFGLFVILAYVTGHLVQAFGNMIEFAFWKPLGGKPSDWIRKQRQSLLAPAQREAVLEKIKTKLGLSIPDDLSKFGSKAWAEITSQIYACVRSAGGANRIDIFNANYGMFRGIASSILLVLLILTLQHGFALWKLSVALVLALVACLYRMFRFGRHYARELFVQFLALAK